MMRRNVQPRYLAGVLCCLALAVVEIGGSGDDRLGDALPQLGLGVLLQLAEDHRRYLRRGVGLAGDLHVGIIVGRLDDLVGQQLDVLLDLGVAELPTHQPLDGVDRIVRVGNGLPLGGGARVPLAGLGIDRHHGRRSSPTLCIFDDRGLGGLHDRHA